MSLIKKIVPYIAIATLGIGTFKLAYNMLNSPINFSTYSYNNEQCIHLDGLFGGDYKLIPVKVGKGDTYYSLLESLNEQRWNLVSNQRNVLIEIMEQVNGKKPEQLHPGDIILVPLYYADKIPSDASDLEKKVLSP
ncbi:MAG: hypothetical protein QXW00_03950 [Candidatus Woesearchaeota archaeon]